MIRCVLAVSLLLAGCATHPTSTASTPSVPTSRILTKQWLSPSAETGTLIIKRDAGSMSAACQVRSSLNRSAIADMAPKEKVELYLPPGEYVLSASLHGLCGAGAIVETAVAIKTGATATYRISAGLSGELAIQPTAF